MAFHLHLINPPCDCLNAVRLEVFRGPAANPAQPGRPILAWAMGTDGQLTSRWVLARD